MSSPPDLNEEPPEQPTRGLPLRAKTLLVAAVVVGLSFRFFDAVSLVLLGLLAAACVASLLRPVRDRVPGPRWVGALAAELLPLGALIGLGWAITSRMRASIGHVAESLGDLRATVNDQLQSWTSGLGLSWSPDAKSIGTRLLHWVTSSQGSLLGETTDLASRAILWLAFVFFGSLYMLFVSRRELERAVLARLSERHARRLVTSADALEEKLRRWALGTLSSMVLVGAATWGGFAIIGLPFALVLGLLAGFGEIVPTVGPLLAFAVAAAVGASQGSSAVLGVVAVWLAVQTLESYVLLPFIMRKAVRVPPVVTLFTVVLWGKILGLAGLLLALPLDLTLWTLWSVFRRDGRGRAEDDAHAHSAA